MKDLPVLGGSEYSKNLQLNTSALKEGLYKDVDVLIAMEIVHAGQWPRFLTEITYAGISGCAVKLSPTDIDDEELKHQILKQATTIEEIQNVVDVNYTVLS